MRVQEKYPYIINRLIIGVHNFLGITLGFLCIFLLLRLGEYLLLRIGHSGISQLGYYESKAMMFDIVYFINLSSILFVPIVVLSIVFDFRVVNFLYTLLGSFFLLVYALLIYYFSDTFNPLGADLFAYSEKEIRLIVGAAGVLNAWLFLAMGLFLYLCFKIPALFRKIDWHYSVLIVYLLAAIVTWNYTQSLQPNPNSYKKEINFFLSSNKLAYFIRDVQKHEIENSDLVFDGFYFDDDLTDNSFKYIDPDNYPFLNADTTQDVLSNYFNKASSAPNLVFIIVEGLGRSYSGPDAELGSFTPFLDSLAEHSLYWQNFVSNGGRTFAALPSIFGSLPFGEKGFLEYAEKAPVQQSLIRLLKINGYFTSFYHGGDATFDYMSTFLQRQMIDKIVDEKSFPPKYKKMPSNNQSFTWGYGDMELFDYYFSTLENSNKPRLDIFLTLSNHSPFKVKELDYYRLKFDNRLKDLDITGEGRLAYNSYRDMYSCVLYSDDAIKKFIDEYKKRPEYQNTIFIITGDHRMPEIPIDRRIDQFRVPLIVYSPLLKRKASFKGVSSHLDLTPSLLSFLRLNYRIKRPLQQSWLGSELDTSRFFSSKKFIPMMRNKNELQDFIDRSVYSSNKRVYKLSDRFVLANSTDLIAQRIMEGRISEFLNKNASLKYSYGLIPDSVYNFSVGK